MVQNDPVVLNDPNLVVLSDPGAQKNNKENSKVKHPRPAQLMVCCSTEAEGQKIQFVVVPDMEKFALHFANVPIHHTDNIKQL